MISVCLTDWASLWDNSRGVGPFFESEPIFHCGSYACGRAIITPTLQHTASTAPVCRGQVSGAIEQPTPPCSPISVLNLLPLPPNSLLGPLAQCASRVSAFPLCSMTWRKLRKHCYQTTYLQKCNRDWFSFHHALHFVQNSLFPRQMRQREPVKLDPIISWRHERIQGLF